MNSRRLFLRALLGTLGWLSVGSLSGQTNPNLAPPQAREKVLATAQALLAGRDKPAPLPNPLPNPFVAKEPDVVEVPQVAAPTATTPAPVVSGAELLARLAARVPSTGTLALGGQSYLLVGQKRLKVGDTYAVTLDGQSYDLTLVAITSTSFTVKRGEIIHTRPVRMPSASTTPRP